MKRFGRFREGQGDDDGYQDLGQPMKRMYLHVPYRRVENAAKPPPPLPPGDRDDLLRFRYRMATALLVSLIVALVCLAILVMPQIVGRGWWLGALVWIYINYRCVRAAKNPNNLRMQMWPGWLVTVLLLPAYVVLLSRHRHMIHRSLTFRRAVRVP